MNKIEHNATPSNRIQNMRFYTSSFNGKEKDPESGFHYYGARYYWSELMTGWLSVDPMTDKYPSLSPYNYCVWNPLRLIDPNGEGPRDRIYYATKMLHIPYQQQYEYAPQYYRTSNTDAGLQYMDCSEFVCRVMYMDGITRQVESHNTTDLMDNVFGNTNLFEESITPQEGDIFVWKKGGGNRSGHTGIVKSYDDKNQSVTIIHETSYGNISESVEETYSLKYFQDHNASFFHPVNETEDIANRITLQEVSIIEKKIDNANSSIE